MLPGSAELRALALADGWIPVTSTGMTERGLIRLQQNARTPPVLRVEKLKVGGLPPLSFEVAGGECLSIEGRSGAGKTRLLRAIADLDPSAGYVAVQGLTRSETPAPAWRGRVRYLPAEPGWWAPTLGQHCPPGAAGQRFVRLLTQLEVSADLLARPIETLSTGERRRAALALGLADGPDVLLADEPTLGLDSARAALVEELIRYQLLSGRTVLLVAHDDALIGRLAHRRLQLTPPEDAAPQSAKRGAPLHAR